MTFGGGTSGRDGKSEGTLAEPPHLTYLGGHSGRAAINPSQSKPQTNFQGRILYSGLLLLYYRHVWGFSHHLFVVENESAVLTRLAHGPTIGFSCWT